MPLLVNQELIDDAAFREEARAIRPRLREAMAGQDSAEVEERVRQWARENVIERVVLRQAALADPEPLLPAVAADPEAEIRQRIERLLARASAHLSVPRNKDVTDYYRKNRESFLTPERVHAAHIVINAGELVSEAAALAAIQDVERALRDGGNFEELADKYSDCPGRGGDLGVFPLGEMVPEFDAVVFALQAGEVSAVFRTGFGFHIAKVYQKWPEGVPELSEVRARIEQLLLDQKKQKAIEQYLDRLIAKAEIREA